MLMSRKALMQITPNMYSININPPMVVTYYEDESPFEDETADIFLHGVCYVFAQALYDKYGYVMRQIGNGTHVFCVLEKQGRTFFVDVRGITNNRFEFFKEFFCSNPDSLEDYAGWTPNEKEPEELYEFSLAIIEDSAYKELYII